MLSLLYIVQRSIPATTLFPYTTLFRSRERAVRLGPDARRCEQLELLRHAAARRQRRLHAREDRKSTRLNSSHLVNSYPVYCLKKKKKNAEIDEQRTK